MKKLLCVSGILVILSACGQKNSPNGEGSRSIAQASQVGSAETSRSELCKKLEEMKDSIWVTFVGQTDDCTKAAFIHKGGGREWALYDLQNGTKKTIPIVDIYYRLLDYGSFKTADGKTKVFSKASDTSLIVITLDDLTVEQNGPLPSKVYAALPRNSANGSVVSYLADESCEQSVPADKVIKTSNSRGCTLSKDLRTNEMIGVSGRWDFICEDKGIYIDTGAYPGHNTAYRKSGAFIVSSKPNITIFNKNKGTERLIPGLGLGFNELPEPVMYARTNDDCRTVIVCGVDEYNCYSIDVESGEKTRGTIEYRSGLFKPKS